MGRASRFLLPLIVAIAAPAVAMAQSVAPIRDGDRTLGSPTAPVTLTVYQSATCSHCADWHNDDFPAFRAKYVDSGQVRVAFRDLPTPPQPLAIAGAVMARCVPEERYDNALSALFEGQKALRDAGTAEPAVIAWLRAAGEAGGLTPEQMNTCMGDRANFETVQARASQSFADGVQGTPTFLINGERIPDSAYSPEGKPNFDSLIQPLLAGR